MQHLVSAAIIQYVKAVVTAFSFIVVYWYLRWWPQPHVF